MALAGVTCRECIWHSDEYETDFSGKRHRWYCWYGYGSPQERATIEDDRAPKACSEWCSEKGECFGFVDA